MKLSESIRKNVVRVEAGKIINNFKVNPRRNVLFFEEILANYVKECEKNGFEDDIKEACRLSTLLATSVLTPSMVKKLPPTFFINNIARKVWKNIGGVDDLYFTKTDNKIKIRTKGELISRHIGENRFCEGCFEGVINSFYNMKCTCVSKKQTSEKSEYIFDLKNELPDKIPVKSIELYKKLNDFPVFKGLELKTALKKKIFSISKNNRITFRGKTVILMENTLFHIISNKKMLHDKIPDISFEFFSSIIEKKSTMENKLALLKNILQISGWGIINIGTNGKKISVSIKNLPYGLQAENDNWDFISNVIKGYMWTVDKRYRINESKISNRNIFLEFILP